MGAQRHDLSIRADAVLNTHETQHAHLGITTTTPGEFGKFFRCEDHNALHDTPAPGAPCHINGMSSSKLSNAPVFVVDALVFG